MEVLHMATQVAGNAKNILVGASPLFISNIDVTTTGYQDNAEAGVLFPALATGAAIQVPLFKAPTSSAEGESYTDTLNAIDAEAFAAGDPKKFAYRNVGYTNNGLQVTYNPSYGSVTVDQLLDTAKLFKESMEVMIATEMAEGTLQNILTVFGQSAGTLTDGATTDKLGLAGGALGEAPTERQLIAVGQAPTSGSGVTKAERVYYARRVLSVQQSQFSLARNAASTFPVTFRLLPDGSKQGQEYGFIVDRVLSKLSA
jgi:hypothetical protein